MTLTAIPHLRDCAPLLGGYCVAPRWVTIHPNETIEATRRAPRCGTPMMTLGGWIRLAWLKKSYAEALRRRRHALRSESQRRGRACRPRNSTDYTELTQESMMSICIAPLRDMRFVMTELAGLGNLPSLPGWEKATPELADAVLDEAAKLATEVLAPLSKSGDQ
ncbi:acyl-CoA dehydrogenase N-terminal domain-containing protein [Paraburkholderia atlantica]|uniref:acyl-CoA dehydrogenase N-terminal domain-containing protein n=1 Tax=Paraburkholderia atlantica TaxID=2654982 RepID=UPI001827157A|nr:acyl-CoA dehydrogenase N-terminal domain-containing protein [Paraburkholderia atlantica]MBB5414309.1 hypothetical protein [Paraburkholderia atlantica]